MSNGITYVGLDVHKATIQVAMLPPGSSAPVEWKITNTPDALRRLARRLQREAPEEIRSCYEAGPTGYATHRRLTELGIPCIVIAPSLIPRRPGDRIKTDRRDARKLAGLLRADLLTEVHPPNEQDDRAQERLHARYRRMMARGKAHPKTIVAMARELVGYLWAVLTPDPLEVR